MAKEYTDMRQLRDTVARHYGRRMVQFTLSLPVPDPGHGLRVRGALSWALLFLRWSRRLLTRRNVDNRLGELIGVPRAFGPAPMTRSTAFALPVGERHCLHGFVCRWFGALIRLEASVEVRSERHEVAVRCRSPDERSWP
jgi:hypothetical protein